jgi:hypothetical protein
MRTRKERIAIWQLDESRFALGIDEIIRFVGSLEECERRAAILMPKDDRERQDRALAHACRQD